MRRCGANGTVACRYRTDKDARPRVGNHRGFESPPPPFCYIGQAARSHSTRFTHFSCPLSTSVSSTPEMRTPKASFLTLEGTRITPACERLSPAHSLKMGSKSRMLAVTKTRPSAAASSRTSGSESPSSSTSESSARTSWPLSPRALPLLYLDTRPAALDHHADLLTIDDVCDHHCGFASSLAGVRRPRRRLLRRHPLPPRSRRPLRSARRSQTLCRSRRPGD
jgi:hypothetical protein